MPRTARIIIPGFIYHVTQRGNNRQDIFFNDNDYILYLKRIAEYSNDLEVKIYAYCLMKNHVHFIVEPKHEYSLAKMFRAVNMRYAKYYQRKTNSSGHVWQGRYFSCLLQGQHLREAVRYVDLNPVRANIVIKPWQYSWSSARAHLGKEYKWIKLSDINNILDVGDWKEYLLMKEDDEFLKKIRKLTRRNVVMGSEEFVEKIKQALGRKI